ncbi:MAG: galactose-1-phosphate uridylyltransferase [Endomicrobium sp.]|jgi:UDPglucose--hexose-1-phosphate uridylyltransferase|nr:galactose-1-phosphate uridylyltransferase [Endomicrobium sp.]
MPEFRRDPIIGRWVIVDPSRSFKKMTYSAEEEYPKDVSKCPFCAGNESMTRPEILAYADSCRQPNSKNWTLRVIPNNKPILEIEGALKRRGEGMYDKMDGIGAHEIIIETPKHCMSIADKSEKEYGDVYSAIIERVKDLRRDTRLEYILAFKNYGISANALFEHPHSQLIAMPIVPKRVREEITGAENYFKYKERCVFCDIIAQETSSGIRVVEENEDFIALCPYASRYPFETWVLPKNHFTDFDLLPNKELKSLSKISRSVFVKLYNVLDNPSYSSLIHTSPLKEKNMSYYHWHIEIIPKLTKTAGFEWGSGLYVNPVLPEEAAKYLRESE